MAGPSKPAVAGCTVRRITVGAFAPSRAGGANALGAVVPLRRNQRDLGLHGEQPPTVRSAAYDSSVFATLLGGLPRPTRDDAGPDGLRSDTGDPLGTRDPLDARVALGDVIVAAIRAQEEAGLEPVTDGRLGDPAFAVVERWRFAASLTDRAVKQALPGPYSIGRQEPRSTGRVAERSLHLMGSMKADRRERTRRTMAAAEDLRRDIEALTAAGCPLIEIEEGEAHRIGEDEGERRLFREAHQLLAEGVTGAHLSLSIVGGSAAGAGLETILAAPYASLAVDLIAGPDNWNLVVRMPPDRGVVAGALSAREGGDESRELLLWAAHYAASTGGRGIARVGIGSGGSFATLTWAVAVRKMQLLGEAARLAAMPPSDELRRSLTPAAVSARRAALGHDAPPRPRRHR